MSILKAGDEVAILPYVWAEPSKVLEIVKIHFAGAVITELADGRMFATGVGVGVNNTCFMTRVREVHRAAEWPLSELERGGIEVSAKLFGPRVFKDDGPHHG